MSSPERQLQQEINEGNVKEFSQQETDKSRAEKKPLTKAMMKELKESQRAIEEAVEELKGLGEERQGKNRRKRPRKPKAEKEKGKEEGEQEEKSCNTDDIGDTGAQQEVPILKAGDEAYGKVMLLTVPGGTKN